MSKNIEEARRSLEKAKRAAEAKIAQLDEDRRSLKASIKSLDAVIRVLTKRDKKSTPRASDNPLADSKANVKRKLTTSPESTDSTDSSRRGS